MAPTYRAWQKSEIEMIHRVMKEYAPWRGERPYEDPEFMAAWLNNFQLIEQNTGHPTTEEELIAWWKSTDEYKDNENWTPNPPDPGPDPDNPELMNPIVGQLRLNGSGFADDAGPVLPIGLHLGDIFSKFTRDPDHAKRYLSTAVGAGYRIIQFWMNLGTLGGSYWAGRECGPNITPDFFGQLARFSDLLDSFKLKGVYNVGDYKLRGISHDDMWFQIDQILQGRDTAAFAFAGNEAWQTGAGSGDECWQSIRNLGSGVLKTSTSPPDESSQEIARWCRGHFYAMHGWRDGEDHDRLRHIFSVDYEGGAPMRHGYQDEPTGPGNEVSVKAYHCYHGRDVDANHMCALAFQSLMCNQAFNYFCSEGIKSDGDITKRAGFYEVPKVASLLPIDVQSWAKAFHFGDRFADRRIFKPVSGNSVRFEQRVSPDGRFVGLLYGDEGHAVIENTRPCEMKLLGWDGTVLHQQGFNKGQQFAVDFVRSRDGQPGHTAIPVTGKL